MEVLCANHGFSYVLTATTAPPRPGSERIHLSDHEFSALEQTGEIFQVTAVYEHRYGLFADAFRRLQPLGQRGVVDFNYRQRMQWDSIPGVVRIVYMPPSPRGLEANLLLAGRQSRIREALIDYDGTMRDVTNDIAAGRDVKLIYNHHGKQSAAAAEVFRMVKQVEEGWRSSAK
jgi:guanylate kinase